MRTLLAILALLLATARPVWPTETIGYLVISDPWGAVVYVDGQPVGHAPCQVRLHQGGMGDLLEVLRLELPGYEPLTLSGRELHTRAIWKNYDEFEDQFRVDRAAAWRLQPEPRRQDPAPVPMLLAFLAGVLLGALRARQG